MNNIVPSTRFILTSIVVFNLILRSSRYTINCYYFNKISLSSFPFFLIYDSLVNPFY